jgi:C-terminal processing protease CtpA/Prc
MSKKLLIGIAAIGLSIGALVGAARAQEPSPSAEEREQAKREDEAAAQIELDKARARLDEARRELEAAAREVAELSRRGPYVAGMPFPPLGARAELGIAIEDGDDGVRVTAVTPGGPAAAAGIAVGDVIAAIDSTTLTDERAGSRQLIEHMQHVNPGQNVVLQTRRGGDARTVSVMAREAENDFVFWRGPAGERFVIQGPGGPVAGGIAVGPDAGPAWVGPGMRFNAFLGGRWNDLELVGLTPELGTYFGTAEGLLVVRSPDDAAVGLKDGDVILEIGGRAPTSPEHAMRILMSFEPGETLTFSIMRAQRRQTVEYVIPGNRSEG